jgi:F0F1-type ATP synthase delta subunit
MMNLNKHYANALVRYSGTLGTLGQWRLLAGRLLDGTAEGRDMPDALARFLALVPAKHRKGTLRRFARVARDNLGLLDMRVISAHPLSDGQLDALARRFEGVTGRPLAAVNEVDARLTGGVRVLVGGRLYDGSVDGQIKRINQAMKEVLISDAK